MEKTVGKGILHFDKENFLSYVAIETEMINVIGGFGADFFLI